MKKFFTITLVFIFLGFPAFSQEKGLNENPPVEVMVLGTFHLSNPGLDVANAQVDYPRTPKRQRELKALSKALADFNPTKVAVEATTDRGDLVHSPYHDFDLTVLGEVTNERVQIGFRTAFRLGHEHVFAIDEKNGNYFPFEKVSAYAEKTGNPLVSEIVGFAQKKMRALETRLETESIPALLRDYNDPDKILDEHRLFYNKLLTLGDAGEQPGALLNARWFERNAKIFTKMTEISKPGDKVLIVFGAGHAYWLRYFIANTPGYVLIEPGPYLKKAVEILEKEGQAEAF